MIPVLSIVAISGFRLVQVPPTDGVKEDVDPTQIVVSPSTAITGLALTCMTVDGRD